MTASGFIILPFLKFTHHFFVFLFVGCEGHGDIFLILSWKVSATLIIK